MNRKMSAVAAVVLMLAVIICAALPAFAALAPTQDGVYEVSVKMYHAQKDKTSMGDKYLVHTALLTVKNGSKTLTIATPESVSGMQFWYYKNGGVEGDTVEVKPAGSVKIAGTTYQSAFEFPIVGNGEFVGVKFAAPVMPMSPSARIHIDYASAKKVADIGSAAVTAPNAVTPTKPTESAKGEASVDTTASAPAETDSTGETVTGESISENEASTVSESVADPVSETTSNNSGSKKTAAIIGSVFAAVVIVVLIVATVIKRKAIKE